MVGVSGFCPASSHWLFWFWLCFLLNKVKQFKFMLSFGLENTVAAQVTYKKLLSAD